MSLWALIPAILVILLWSVLDGAIIESLVKSSLPADTKQLDDENLGLVMTQVENVASGIGSIESLGKEYAPAVERLSNMQALSAKAMPILTIIVLIISCLLGFRAVTVKNNARYAVEKVFNATLFICSSIAIFTTFGIVFSVLFESLNFFQKVPFFDFVFGTHWSALLISVPVGLMSAIYLSEYASARVRGIVKPILEILAGVPTVVYGFFAALTVAPAIRRYGDAARDWGASQDISWLANLNVSSESALAAGIVMGVMIIPFVSSLSDDVINAVPQSLRDGSYGLGATQSETIKKVIFPAALPGVVGGVLLAASRAIGETFVITLILNVIALKVVKKYREQYD